MREIFRFYMLYYRMRKMFPGPLFNILYRYIFVLTCSHYNYPLHVCRVNSTLTFRELIADDDSRFCSDYRLHLSTRVSLATSSQFHISVWHDR